jgi:hypothetical protein
LRNLGGRAERREPRAEGRTNWGAEVQTFDVLRFEVMRKLASEEAGKWASWKA